jgi:hypothetical protein
METKEEIKKGIIWEIDHDYSYGCCLLVGDFKGQRFVKGVKDGFFSFNLMLAKWSIQRKFIMLYKK